MAALTTYVKGDGDALRNNALGMRFVEKFTIDTATTNVADSAILKLMDVPADTYIEDIVVEVRTAEGGTLTLDIGDYLIATEAAVDADGYFDGLNGNSAAVSTVRAQLAEDTTAIAYAEGKFYSSHNSFIGILFNDAADAAIFDVYIIGTKLGN